jgi:FKBP-type peptidyl-prolyl cis-trans isomerase 2
MKKLAIFFLLILAACAPQEIQQNVTNVTIETGAQKGDLVSINFILTLENGTVVDTNNATLAQEYGLSNYVKGPYTFILGQSGKVKGFDEALIGIKLGERKETTIEPSEEEVSLTINKTQIMERYVSINKKQAFPTKAYEKMFGKKPIKGDIAASREIEFKYKILNVTNDTVIAEMHVKEGEKYTLPNTEWTSAVVKVAEEDVMFYFMPEENQTISAPFGTATITLPNKSRMHINYQPELNKIFNKTIELGKGFSIPQEFQVTEVRDNDFIIKRYNVLAEKRLKLTAELIEITEDVKEIREKSTIKTETLS